MHHLLSFQINVNDAKIGKMRRIRENTCKIMSAHGECTTRENKWEKTALYFHYWSIGIYIFLLTDTENNFCSINDWCQAISPMSRIERSYEFYKFYDFSFQLHMLQNLRFFVKLYNKFYDFSQLRSILDITGRFQGFCWSHFGLKFLLLVVLNLI